MKLPKFKQYVLASSVVMTLLINSAWAGIDVHSINKDALVKDPVIVECSLENGDVANCAKFVVKYQPDNLKTGPFCPESIDQKGGIWDWDGEMAGLYQIDKGFLSMLDSQGYHFYDEDGKVNITDVRTTQPKNNNSCLQASVDKTVEMTVLIPINPVKAEKVNGLGTVAKVGLALDGVPIFADAPSVLETGHMPALDKCGGHVDPGGWYHWHSTATDIDSVYKEEHLDIECHIEQKASAIFAYAFDGFPIYGSLELSGKIPENLDICGGHFGPTNEYPKGIYHYHASTTFPNLPTCLHGVVAKDNFSTTAKQGIGAEGGPGQGGGPGHGTPPGFDKAAKTLGVTEKQLMQVIMNNGGRNLDVTAAAKELGVTETQLKEALPTPPEH
ncbi:YHYH protein [Psychromonas sp. GE-S-Ul-11]|uniref:YHYH protein n=1 Tax=Psychromonas sp. GE-S-Ul-11 TaxID=3241170 RepID=UPI00390C5445